MDHVSSTFSHKSPASARNQFYNLCLTLSARHTRNVDYGEMREVLKLVFLQATLSLNLSSRFIQASPTTIIGCLDQIQPGIQTLYNIFLPKQGMLPVEIPNLSTTLL